MTRRLAASLAILSLLVSTTAVVPAATLAACDPFTTPPSYTQGVRTSSQVIGFALGSQEVSVAESNAYLEAVDTDSSRVVHDVAATSVGGLAIDYAIVGTPDSGDRDGPRRHPRQPPGPARPAGRR